MIRTLALLGALAGAALPPPVQVREEPDGVTLEDPAFEALPGARADFGRLGGAVYEIEVPDRWNGRLVLFMHGYGELRAEAGVTPPAIRRYLIGQGYAWGASSFSSTSLIPGRAADETAAVWDLFARREPTSRASRWAARRRTSPPSATATASTARWRCAGRRARHRRPRSRRTSSPPPRSSRACGSESSSAAARCHG
jgi:hypothetical protein